MDLNDPTTACLLVADALNRAGLRGALYGGLALAAFGEPRETKDADFVVAGATPDQLVAALEAIGHGGVITFDWTRFGGNRVARVTLLGGDSTTGLNVADLVEPCSERFAQRVLDRALSGELRGQTLSIVRPEDFVLLKALSTRDRDLEDAASVVRALGADLDLQLIHEEAALLAAELPESEVTSRLERVLRALP
ncbi:MAG: nucleotidyltransferase [Planctomycetota bacterium]